MIFVEIFEALESGLGLCCEFAQWGPVSIRADLAFLTSQHRTAYQDDHRSSPQQQQRLSWTRSLHEIDLRRSGLPNAFQGASFVIFTT